MSDIKNFKFSLMVCILLVSLSVSIIPTASAQGNIIGLSSLARLEWGNETKEPILPGQEIVQIDLTVEYEITKSWFLSRLVYNLYKGKQVNINLEIIDSPSWASTTLAQETLTTTIPQDIDETQILNTSMMINVNTDAPAFSMGGIRVNLSIDPIKGIFGFRDIIQGSNQTFDIPITPDYLPDFSVEKPSTEIIEIPPYNETIIPLNITNSGNAKTKINAEIEQAPENWTVSIGNITLDAFEGTGQVFLKIYADHNFDTENIKIKFTPAYSEDTNLKGNSKTVTLTFQNDGSYVEPDDNQIDITILIIILTVILVLIVIAGLIIKRRR